MIYTIQNKKLTVKISDAGAEICSVTDSTGTEFIWQGDPAFWEGHSPVLFPYCGRVWNNLCTAYGVPCGLGLHGFFWNMKTEGEQISDTSVAFSLSANAETLAIYPFDFQMKVIYTLADQTLTVRAEIQNRGTRPMPYGYGVHPGFCLPADEAAAESFYLAFPAENPPRALCLDAGECYPVGGERDFALLDGSRFYIPHGDLSAILRDRAGEAVLAGDDSAHRITLRYPSFPYLTLWRPAGAPFVCIEPWMSLPSTFGLPTELTEKEDLVRLAGGEATAHEFCISFD